MKKSILVVLACAGGAAAAIAAPALVSTDQPREDDIGLASFDEVSAITTEQGRFTSTPGLRAAIDVDTAEVLGTDGDGATVLLANGLGANRGLACTVRVNPVATNGADQGFGVACYELSRAVLDAQGEVGPIAPGPNGTQIISMIVPRGTKAFVNDEPISLNGRVGTYTTRTKGSARVVFSGAGYAATYRVLASGGVEKE